MFRKGGVFSQYSLNVSGWDHLHTDNLLKTVSETQLNCIIDQNPRHRTTADQAGHCQQHICDFIFPVKSRVASLVNVIVDVFFFMLSRILFLWGALTLS